MLASGAFASKLIFTVATANAVAAAVSSEWAIPLNTLLLIVLALVSSRNGRKLDDTKNTVVETKEHVIAAKADATHAASAAAAAAAAAATAARIAKEIGGAARTVQVAAETAASTAPTPATETGPNG